MVGDGSEEVGAKTMTVAVAVVVDNRAVVVFDMLVLCLLAVVAPIAGSGLIKVAIGGCAPLPSPSVL